MLNNVQNTNTDEEGNNNNTIWYLQDDDCKFVFADSCKRVSKNEYIYTAYDKLERSYPTQSAAEIALLKLERACYFGKIDHHFTIISEPKQEPTCFVIKDQDNRFVDGESIFVLSSDDGKSLDWWCTSFSTEINSIYRYPTKDYAEQVMAKLNALKQLAGFSDIEFHVEEFTRENTTPAEMTVTKIPVPKGKRTLHRKLLCEIRNQYMN